MFVDSNLFDFKIQSCFQRNNELNQTFLHPGCWVNWSQKRKFKTLWWRL